MSYTFEASFDRKQEKQLYLKKILDVIPDSNRSIVLEYLQDPHEFGIEIRVNKQSLEEIKDAFQKLGFKTSEKLEANFVRLSVLPD